MGGQGWQPLVAKSMCAMCEFMAIFSPYFFSTTASERAQGKRRIQEREAVQEVGKQ